MIHITYTRVASVALALLLVFSSVGGVAAQSDNPEWGQELFEEVEGMVGTYNDNIDSVDLGPVSLAGTTNIYVNDGSEQATYAVTMDADNHIENLQQGTDDAAKRKITTDRATLQNIANSPTPAAAFRNAVANDDIVITGENGQIIEQVKWTVLNVLKGFLL